MYAIHTNCFCEQKKIRLDEFLLCVCEILLTRRFNLFHYWNGNRIDRYRVYYYESEHVFMNVVHVNIFNRNWILTVHRLNCVFYSQKICVPCTSGLIDANSFALNAKVDQTISLFNSTCAFFRMLPKIQLIAFHALAKRIFLFTASYFPVKISIYTYSDFMEKRFHQNKFH